MTRTRIAAAVLAGGLALAIAAPAGATPGKPDIGHLGGDSISAPDRPNIGYLGGD